MFRFCLLLCIFMVLIGCEPTEKSPEPPGNSGQTQEPQQPPDEPTVEAPGSFPNRTKAYEMLDVQASKEWLSKNKFTVTEIDDNTVLVQGNYVFGNMTTEVKVEIHKGKRGLAPISSSLIRSLLITDDDEGNIRVGFKK